MAKRSMLQRAQKLEAKLAFHEYQLSKRK